MYSAYPSPTPDAPQTNVELRIECFDLPDLDTFSKSDPRVFVYLQQGQNWIEIGKTETIWNNLSPRFATPIVLPYKFETVQRLRFLVVDIDSPDENDPTKHDFLGYIETTLATLVANGKRQPFEQPLSGQPPPGQVGFNPVGAGRRGSIRRADKKLPPASPMLAPSVPPRPSGSGRLSRNGSLMNQPPPSPISPNGAAGGYPGLARSGTVTSTISAAPSHRSQSSLTDTVTNSLRNLNLVPRGRGAPRIRVLVEELKEQGANEFVLLRCSGQGLDKKDLFGKSDPFLLVEKRRDDGEWVPVHRTPEIRKTLNPNWPPFRLPLSLLNNNTPTRPLRWSVWDWNASGKEDFIGSVEAPMTRVRAGEQLYLINEAKRAKKGSKYVNSGVLVFVEVGREVEWSFFDFVSRGCEVALAVAVDFTQSNGDPRLPTSLHYRNPSDPGALNEYQRAITAVGTVLEPYDSDKMFPVYGFGARIQVQNGPPMVSHLFPLNLNYENPIVSGVGGMMAAYGTSLRSVELWGPTNFAPVITETTRWANGGWTPGSQTLDRYSILLIITDGAITDMPDTVDAVVEASRAPLSIIIVGVGGADFTSMRELDADERPLEDGKGRKMERDCVQFVPFRQFQHDFTRLSSETLAEVPRQFTEWCKPRGVRPIDT
ncbi:Copine-domain-containing protein [Gonapodya prolifera JEL478]|uniref:Copine-domain-containing protein n=1 Tax=Gonapodya prolifera (strain JEL478) TaxID=1344416 RepID=A0A139ASA4_GONPJ|nr:Copine-domain-containing protein [Gonapodya prolifera JEL478]|eukprot:KXS19628.1 Copine-domain-containing protein [Gonapodya prolifera JEL478]